MLAIHGAHVVIADIDPAAVVGGHGRVDVLVNNVGHSVYTVPHFIEGDTSLWRQLRETNFFHTLLVTRPFSPSNP
jgi:2-hydroxycyclohexanecarboxyl-CoA dehydrogenase